MDGIIESMDKVFNSGIGFTLLWLVIVGFFWWLASRYNPFVEKWKKYEGSIITAIRLAEKQIPDDTPNAGLARLDAALDFVLKAYAQANNGKYPSKDLVHELREGIQIKHNELSRFGGIGFRPQTSDLRRQNEKKASGLRRQASE